VVDGGWDDSIIMYVRYCALAYCGGGDLFFFLPLRVLPVCEDGSQICDDGVVRSGGINLAS